MTIIRYRARVSRHDHTGHMAWGVLCCVCTDCGQEWRLGRGGWHPQPGRHGPIVTITTTTDPKDND